MKARTDLPFSDCVVGLLFVIPGQCPCGGQRGQLEPRQ